MYFFISLKTSSSFLNQRSYEGISPQTCSNMARILSNISDACLWEEGKEVLILENIFFTAESVSILADFS